jgi:hypothetical protein
MPQHIFISDFSGSLNKIIIASSTEDNKKLVMLVDPVTNYIVFLVHGPSDTRTAQNLLDAIKIYNDL